MDRLKTILADKILDLTSSSNEDVKAKIEKIQRFRDFANACQSLSIKYPQIEDELIKMVHDGDFDAKVASSRVDSVIRMADKEPETIIEQTDDTALSTDDLTENIDFEIIDTTENEEDVSYTDYEESEPDENHEEVLIEIETELNDDELAAIKRKKVIKMVVQITAVIVALALLIIAVKFVMSHWQTILIILGVILLILVLVWALRRKKS